ncbi:hypothetical protein SPRG_14131 [Saprolegnia parasitica CBS 223.65]|uniref:MARVEL domain-containing protein n=1 Tax=Saprolegnia parasitica (strain CBS 223.65) TaxID=695850 RepID=A0A067BVM9_SAPPC|nr:hypothetical protein SPRG_14131 [Saprolegnia parasitica CBS 223.65]KDO20900.1 hypothetical protein SPRG_14131 [Saprolegnia parasitica CBS 223.65]|eukprot:XP_012208389.1 hypothetical protein SPRG_14131 [Saprolegnia parasitica CBS 223.65]
MPSLPPRLLSVLVAPALPQVLHGASAIVSLGTAAFTIKYLQTTSCNPFVSVVSKTGPFQFLLASAIITACASVVWMHKALKHRQWYMEKRLHIMAADVVAFVLNTCAGTAINFSAASQYVCSSRYATELDVICDVNCGALNGGLVADGILVLLLLFSVLSTGYQLHLADRRTMFLVQTPATKSTTFMETPHSDCLHVELDTPTMAV